jgi:hypothetical protein
VLAKKGVVINKPVTLGSREAVKAGIAAGYGVSLLPKSVIDTELKAGIFKTKKIHDLDVTYPMNIYHRDKQFSIFARAFLEVLRKQSEQLHLSVLARANQKKKLACLPEFSRRKTGSRSPRIYQLSQVQLRASRRIELAIHSIKNNLFATLVVLMYRLPRSRNSQCLFGGKR